MKLFADEDMVY